MSQSGCSSTVIKILPGAEGLPKQMLLRSHPGSQPILALACSPTEPWPWRLCAEQPGCMAPATAGPGTGLPVLTWLAGQLGGGQGCDACSTAVPLAFLNRVWGTPWGTAIPTEQQLACPPGYPYGRWPPWDLLRLAGATALQMQIAAGRDTGLSR